MITSSLRTATGSLFGAVTATAGSVGTAFTAVTHGLTMLDNYAKNSLSQQEDRQLIDNEDFRQRLIEEQSSHAAERQLRIAEFCKQSSEHQSLYATNHDRFVAAFTKRDADRAAAKKQEANS